jgi:riboflavin kinase/FMN adenylyltransferase
LNTYQNIADYNAANGAVVTIGTFDGVHEGHQKILELVRSRAEKDGLTSTLLTFFPHPRMVLQPDHDLKLINTIDERVQLLQQHGIENVIIHPFSQEFSRTTAQEYVEDILVKQLKAKVVVIGYDHRFGRNRSASITELKDYAEIHDFEIIEISKKEVEEVAVSSTKIRHAIEEGDVTTAASYLNKPFSVQGEVHKGKQIGRQLGYPTANLSIPEKYKILPADGVYVTQSEIGGKNYFGLTNVGLNPTISEGNQRTVETYYLDYNADLYSEKIKVEFLKRIRDELRFDSHEELINAMKEDEQYARDFIQQME